MPDDLKDQLRELVETVRPVRAAEAIARAEAHRNEFAAAVVRSSRRRGHSRLIAAAAITVAVAAASAGWAYARSSSGRSSITTPGAKVTGPLPKALLTAAQLRAIVAHSAAASASSGTAEVIQTSAKDGVAQTGYDTAVTFSGANIDERITSVPEPPGSTKSFSTDDRFVGGQFYIYTPGPGDVLEWLHDANSRNDAASMQFPDPRTLYRAIHPEARFTVEGNSMMNGKTVTQLVAADPVSIEPSALGNLATDSTLTSFSLWVDANDVVQQIALSTSQTYKVCQITPSDGPEPTLRSIGNKPVVTHSSAHKPGVAGKCGPMTTISNVTVSFANLGVPESVTPPTGAVEYSGKG